MNDICEEELLALMKKISIRLEIQLEQNLREDDVSGVQVYLLVHILRRHRISCRMLSVKVRIL